jgi:hypothetical protein
MERDIILSNSLMTAAKVIRLGSPFDHTKTVDVLLNSGATVNTRDTEGSALFHAMYEGFEGTSLLLLLHGTRLSAYLTTGRGATLNSLENNFQQSSL